MNKGNVTIGLGSASGGKSVTLLTEQYHIIERINSKPQVAASKLALKKISDIDLGIFKALISKRRNQMLLQSFIGLNEVENDDLLLYNVKEEAERQIKVIKDELMTLTMLEK